MPQSMLNNFDSVRTTVTLPGDLARRSQQLVDKGKVPNRNVLIVAALEHFIAELEREEIDRQFAAMAEDIEYQTLNQEITASFADSDWEAWTIAESSQT
jgi:metal-responsive CopG/Arc/MetJ family transcriptional regulator